MRRVIRELGEFGEKLAQQDRSRDYIEAFETDGDGEEDEFEEEDSSFVASIESESYREQVGHYKSVKSGKISRVLTINPHDRATTLK